MGYSDSAGTNKTNALRCCCSFERRLNIEGHLLNMISYEDISRKTTGVYLIHCLANGKNYVGSSSTCLVHRKIAHLSQLRKNKHHSVLLRRAWNKYGETAFVFSILELCDPSDCITREQFHIDSLQSSNPNLGFNICPAAGSSLGVKFSDDVRARMSARMKGRKLTLEQISAIIKFHTGKKRSMETREKIRQKAIGRVVSAETRLKLSNQRRGSKRSAQACLNIKNGLIASYEASPSKFHCRRVSQFSIDGIFIKTHHTLKSACRAVGVSTGAIWHALNDVGASGKCAGYRWKYAVKAEELAELNKLQK